MSSQQIDPIASLNTDQNKWRIKARVANKSAVLTWNNANGRGNYFRLDLRDESGEIRAVAFKNECDKFYNMIQEEKIYYISSFSVKLADKRYNKLKHNYEITLNENTEVTDCMEDAPSLPTNRYDFVPIIEIGNKAVNTFMDVIGVCKYAAEIKELTAKTGKSLKKREVTLVDSSGGAVDLTLWNNEAETFDGSLQPIVLVMGAQLREYNGSKSLSLASSSTLRLDPDLPEARKLRDWYDNSSADIQVINISAKSGGYGVSGDSNDWITFAEAEARRLGSSDKTDYYIHLGVLKSPIADYSIYKACPLERCHKGLENQENGLFYCKKCDKEYANYKYRILFKATVSDPTGDRDITAFNEVAEAILGASAAEVGRMLDYDKIAYTQLFEEAKFKTFIFKYSTKMEIFNDKESLKTIALSATPINFIEGNARLIKSIKSITGVVV